MYVATHATLYNGQYILYNILILFMITKILRKGRYYGGGVGSGSAGDTRLRQDC